MLDPHIKRRHSKRDATVIKSLRMSFTTAETAGGNKELLKNVGPGVLFTLKVKKVCHTGQQQ